MSYHHKRGVVFLLLNPGEGADKWKNGIGAILVCGFLLFSVNATGAGFPEKEPENWGVEQGDDPPLIDDKKEEAVDEAQVKATFLPGLAGA